MPEFRQRMIAAYAVGAEALAIGLLARGAVRSPLQYVSLVFGVLFARRVRLGVAAAGFAGAVAASDRGGDRGAGGDDGGLRLWSGEVPAARE